MEQEAIRILNADSLSAADVFGSASRLVAQSPAEMPSESAMLDSIPFQCVIFATAVIYIFFLVRYSDIILEFIRTALSTESNTMRKEKGIQLSSEQRNLSIVMALVGIILLSLIAVRLYRRLRPPLFAGDVGIWAGFGIAAAAMTAAIAAECAVLYLAGGLSGRREACQSLIRIKLLYFALGVSVMAPFCISYLLLPGDAASVWLYAAFGLCSVSTLLFVKESFLLFISQRISILFWILYLCILEIFPISLLLSPFLRGEGI